MKNAPNAIGKQLKRLRLSQSLTLEQLAQRAAVSKSMISKIERGDATPTATVLSNLAEALDVSISQLVGGKRRLDVVVMRQEDQPVFRDEQTGFERRSLSPIFPSRGVDFVLNTLPPKSQTGLFHAHRTGVEEHLAVVKGKLRVRVAANEYVLKAGDSMFFQGDVEHQFFNPGNTPCFYYIVIDSSRLR